MKRNPYSQLPSHVPKPSLAGIQSDRLKFLRGDAKIAKQSKSHAPRRYRVVTRDGELNRWLRKYEIAERRGKLVPGTLLQSIRERDLLRVFIRAFHLWSAKNLSIKFSQAADARGAKFYPPTNRTVVIRLRSIFSYPFVVCGPVTHSFSLEVCRIHKQEEMKQLFYAGGDVVKKLRGYVSYMNDDSSEYFYPRLEEIFEKEIFSKFKLWLDKHCQGYSCKHFPNPKSSRTGNAPNGFGWKCITRV